MTLCINDTLLNANRHYAEFLNAVCCVFIVMLSDKKLSVIKLVFMLSVFILSILMLSVLML